MKEKNMDLSTFNKFILHLEEERSTGNSHNLNDAFRFFVDSFKG